MPPAQVVEKEKYDKICQWLDCAEVIITSMKDYVEVTRCKDCQVYDKETGACWLFGSPVNVTEDYFCGGAIAREA